MTDDPQTTSDDEQLRSRRWFGVDDLRAFGHRSRAMQMGFTDADFGGQPVIAILNTWNDLMPCHSHFRDRVEDVKRGVLQAGGWPLEMPVIGLSEPFQKPTTMLYRNLLALEAEEVLRSYPFDGAVLMGGCDKTGPALIMGAISVGLPSIFLPAGPMLHGMWRGEKLGSGSDTWKYWAQRRSGQINTEQWREIEAGIARTPGHCMTMGTASTMTSAFEAMGWSLPGSASIPAAYSQHAMMSAATGRRIVEMVNEGLTPDKVTTAESLHNAVVVCLALAGSTNSIVHLLAIARRAGVDLTLADFDRLAREVPVLADVRPSGRFLMEDFYEAGGVPALMSVLTDLLKLDALGVSGMSLGEGIDGASVNDEEVIRPRSNPLVPQDGLAVLTGSLAPDGCVIKPPAASPDLLVHEGPALVFDSYDEMTAGVDDPSLDVSRDTVLVLRNAGPVGAPGMPEWGMLPLPKKLLQEGVEDMVRISDCRMSGTSYGTCVLHVAPESAVGGPLALVQTGDRIRLDVPGRRLDLLVDEDELARRRAEWTPPPTPYLRGYTRLAVENVTQADQGCDFAFMEGAGGPEPQIH